MKGELARRTMLRELARGTNLNQSSLIKHARKRPTRKH